MHLLKKTEPMHIFIFIVFCVYSYLSSVKFGNFFSLFLLLLTCCISSSAKTSAIQEPILAAISTDNADILSTFFSVINTQILLLCTYRAIFFAFFFTTYTHDIVLRDMTAHTPTWLACRLSICLFLCSRF